MKIKVISILALAIMMASCSNQELIDSDFQQSAPQQKSIIRSYEEALQIAQSSIQMVDGQTQTRAASPRKIALNDSKVCKLDAKTRTSSDVNDTLMYVFNFEDNQGFAVVSARKSQALLAIAEEGYYDPNEEQECKNFEYVMELAKQYVLSAEDANPQNSRIIDPIGLIVEEYTYTVLNSKGNFITVNWGEAGIEASQCSNGFVGSSNLATAMLLSYYSYPTYIDLNYSGMNFSDYPLDWTAIKVHAVGHSSNSTNCNATTSAHNSIAYLCRQIGELSSSTYNSQYTATSQTGTSSALASLGYNCSTLSYNQSLVNQYLNINRPLIISGESNFSRYVWLLDGYQYCEVTVSEIACYSDGTYELISEMQVGNRYYNHFNWGMNGDYNGYYLAGIFDMSEPRPNNNYEPLLPFPLETNFSSNVVMFYTYPNI